MSSNSGIVLQLKDEVDRVQHVAHTVGRVLHTEIVDELKINKSKT